jgi:hypothetical protein
VRVTKQLLQARLDVSAIEIRSLRAQVEAQNAAMSKMQLQVSAYKRLQESCVSLAESLMHMLKYGSQ